MVGWVAFAIGIIFGLLPLAAPDWLSRDTAVTLCVFLLVSGPLLVALSQLITVAGRIADNTSWFSSGGGVPVPQEVAAPVREAPAPEPQAEARPVREEPAPIADEPAAPEPAPTPEPEAEPARPAPSPAAEPELYDANVHPAAVDEWTHRGRRIMTLEDGSFATEISGAWYRFMQLQEIEALR